MVNLIYYLLGAISGVCIKLLVDKYILYEKKLEDREKKFDEWFVKIRAIEEKKRLDN